VKDVCGWPPRNIFGLPDKAVLSIRSIWALIYVADQAIRESRWQKMNSMRRALFWVLAPVRHLLVSKTGKAVGRNGISDGRPVCIRATPAERAAGIIPANQGFPIGDVRRYGALGMACSTTQTRSKNALNLATSAFGTTLIVFPAGLKFKITAYCQIFSNTSIHLFGEIQLTVVNPAYS